MILVALAVFLMGVSGVLAATSVPDIQVTNVAVSKAAFNMCEPLTATATIKENYPATSMPYQGDSTESIDVPTYTVTFYYYRDLLAKPSNAPSTGSNQTGASKLVNGITNIFKLPSLGRFVQMFAIKPAVTPKTYIWPSTATNGENIVKIGEATVPAHKLWRDPAVSNIKTVTFRYWATPEIDNYVIGAWADFSGNVKETDSQRANNQLEKQAITAASYGRCDPLLNLADGNYATYEMLFQQENNVTLKSGESAPIGDYKITADSIAAAAGGNTDALITICKGDECSASTGFKSGDEKSVKADSESVTVKLVSIVWGASITVKMTDAITPASYKTFKIYTNGGKDDQYANIVFENVDEITVPNGTYSAGSDIGGTYGPGKFKSATSPSEGYAAIGAGGNVSSISRYFSRKNLKLINVEADKNGKVTNAQVCIYDPQNSLYLTTPNGGEVSRGNIPISWCTESAWGFNIPVNIGYVSTDPDVIAAHGGVPGQTKSIVGNIVTNPGNPYIWDGKGNKNGPFKNLRLPTGKYKIFISDTGEYGVHDESDSEFTIQPVLQNAKP